MGSGMAWISQKNGDSQASNFGPEAVKGRVIKTPPVALKKEAPVGVVKAPQAQFSHRTAQAADLQPGIGPGLVNTGQPDEFIRVAPYGLGEILIRSAVEVRVLEDDPVDPGVGHCLKNELRGAFRPLEGRRKELQVIFLLRPGF